MSENAVGSFQRNALQRMAASPAGDAADEEDLLCWGFVRGNRRAFNIEFRSLAGPWPALEYPWLVKIVWCPCEALFVPGTVAPGGSIILRYSDGHHVLICGRNLRLVHQKLLDHQVRYVAELDTATQRLSEADAVVIVKIQVVVPGESEN